MALWVLGLSEQIFTGTLIWLYGKVFAWDAWPPWIEPHVVHFWEFFSKVHFRLQPSPPPQEYGDCIFIIFFRHFWELLQTFIFAPSPPHFQEYGDFSKLVEVRLGIVVGKHCFWITALRIFTKLDTIVGIDILRKLTRAFFPSGSKIRLSL